MLIVDPIFRGSRLFYTWIAVSGANERKIKVDILTRTYAITDHFNELFLCNDYELHEYIKLPQDFWYGKIPDEQIENTIKFIRQNKSKYSFVYFVGLNEYLPNLLYKFEKYSSELGMLNIGLVDYDAGYLIENHRGFLSVMANMYKQIKSKLLLKRFKQKTKYQLVKNVMEKYNRLKIYFLDERVFEPKVSKLRKFNSKKLFFLPDPGPVKLVMGHGKQRRISDVKILIVGLQSKRKGICEVFKMLPYLMESKSSTRVLIVGRFDRETEYLKRNIGRYTGILSYHEGFFSEKIIQEFYLETDYVLLPYKKSFNGSSGVMAYSTTFGKPVITTNHGCIGYRTKQFGLGFTYESGKVFQLMDIIKKLPAAYASDYKSMAKNCIKFAELRQIETQKRVIFDSV